MKFMLSLAAALRVKNVISFGNVEVTFKLEDDDQYTLVWRNKMNTRYTSIHKLNKYKFIVEVGSNSGITGVRTLENGVNAVAMFLVNIDAQRIDDKSMADARKHVVEVLKQHEKNLDRIRIPKSVLSMIRRRNSTIKIQLDDGRVIPASLNLVMPSGKLAEVQITSGAETRKVTVSTDRILVE